MTKNSVAIMSAMFLMTTVAGHAAEVSPQATAAKAIGQLGQEMRTKLTESMKKNGPAGSIDVCAKDAPTIISRIEHEQGVTLKRTSQKVRNAQNVPDAVEQELLESLAALQKAGGVLPAGVTVFPKNPKRFYKTIVMEQACLKCHGDATAINEQVRKEITATYPDDKAIGYKEGDFRGIISVLVK